MAIRATASSFYEEPGSELTCLALHAWQTRFTHGAIFPALTMRPPLPPPRFLVGLLSHVPHAVARQKQGSTAGEELGSADLMDLGGQHCPTPFI